MKIKLLITLAVIVIMLASGGCVEKEGAIESTDYEEISLENAETSINYPGFQISSSNGKTAYGRMEYDSVSKLYKDAEETWLLRKGQNTITVIIKVADLNRIPDVKISLPNGNTIYAENFQLDPEYYMPRLISTQEGFSSIKVNIFPDRDKTGTHVIGAEDRWEDTPGVVLRSTEGEAYLISLSAKY